MRNKNHSAIWILIVLFAFCSTLQAKSVIEMRGIVLSVEDLETVDWPKLAHDNGINTIGTHIYPDPVLKFMQSEKGKAFQTGCKRYGIEVEHELHAIKTLLPRNLFQQDSTMFRVNEKGQRTADFNCCPSSSKALDTIAAHALFYAKNMRATNHRYYFWMDDGAPVCHCKQCSAYSASEQALIIENRILRELRTFDKKAMLAHLAYFSSMKAPRKIKPNKGIFLEFAPIQRVMDKPITDVSKGARNLKCNAENLKYLKENLEVFPAKTAVVLEYWLDVSLASSWKKPAVKLPWYPDVFRADLDTYAKMGIRNITSFAVYMDDVYFQKYKDMQCLKDYGEVLKNYR